MAESREREAFERWALQRHNLFVDLAPIGHVVTWIPLGGKYNNAKYQLLFEAWQAAIATERERCAKKLEEIEGREPDYSVKYKLIEAAEAIRKGIGE